MTEHLKDYLKPYWKTDSVYLESVLFCHDDEGHILPASLLYPPTQILSVVASTEEVTYNPRTDYCFDGHTLTLLPDSPITCWPLSSLFLQNTREGSSFPRKGGGHLFFSEDDVFHRMQTLVTYRHTAIWNGPVPKNKSSLLPRTTERLLSHMPLRLLILGDSISVGLNSSGPLHVPPFLGSWWQLVAEGISTTYGISVSCHNVSKVGQTSAWGAKQADSAICDFPANLVFIGFGMNDGSQKVSPEEFRQNIISIMHTVRNACPDVEFVLISSILPNPEAKDFIGHHWKNRGQLLSLEQPGIAVADVTTMHEAFLQRKPYRDMTGNHINHPNDFLARLQAQVVLQTLGCSV